MIKKNVNFNYINLCFNIKPLVVQRSITNDILKSETQFNCPISIPINVHVHQTKFPARRRFNYLRSRTNITEGFVKSLDGSNNNDKDVTTNVAPKWNRPELSEPNVFNAQTDSKTPQKDPTLPLNNNTLPPNDEIILPLCINTLPLPNADLLLQ